MPLTQSDLFKFRLVQLDILNIDDRVWQNQNFTTQNERLVTMKNNKYYLLSAILFGSFIGTQAFAYSSLEYNSDGSFYGICNDGSSSFSGASDGAGYTVSANGVGGNYSSSMTTAINRACATATGRQNTSELRSVPSGTLLLFDRADAEGVSSASSAYELQLVVAQNMGAKKDEYAILSRTASFTPIRYYGNVAVPYWEMVDSEGVTFFAFIR